LSASSTSRGRAALGRTLLTTLGFGTLLMLTILVFVPAQPVLAQAPGVHERYPSSAPNPRIRRAPPPQSAPPPQEQGFRIPILDFLFRGLATALRPAEPTAPAAPVIVRPPAQNRPVIRRVEPTTLVAVVGDSLAENLAQGLAEAFSNRPDVGLIRKIRPGIGFLKDGANWDGALREALDNSKRIAAVVVMLGPRDEPIPPETGGSDAAGAGIPSPWVDLYAARVDDLLLRAREKNIPLIWVGLPPLQPAQLSADYAFVNELVRGRVQAFGGIFVDAWEGFVDPDGRFSATGPNIDGRPTRLRAADGIHFTRAGARKLAHYAEIELRPLLVPKGEDPGAALVTTQPILPGTSRIVLLNATPRSQGASLVSAATASDPTLLYSDIAAQAMVRGDTAAAKPGRADDYTWPSAAGN